MKRFGMAILIAGLPWIAGCEIADAVVDGVADFVEGATATLLERAFHLEQGEG